MIEINLTLIVFIVIVLALILAEIVNRRRERIKRILPYNKEFKRLVLTK